MIFLDTGFLFALVSKRDVHHKCVVEVFREFKSVRLADQLLTTNHVVAEAITLTLKIGHEKAVKLGDQLYREKLARIHWATPDEERAAFDYFKRHQDQTYSVVDCLSFVVMEELGIREALAVDSDLTHRFIARPGPQGLRWSRRSCRFRFRPRPESSLGQRSPAQLIQRIAGSPLRIDPNVRIVLQHAARQVPRSA